MGEVVQFRKKIPKKRGMCQHGFHQWVIDTAKKFDVKQGKLVTVYKCSRCGITKVKAH